MLKVAGVILAGGLAQRIGGGDKGLTRLGGVPILERVIEVLRPQLWALALNANGDPARFRGFCLPVLPDGVAGYPGPLAGLLAGLDWAASHEGADWLLSVPTDTPFLPPDLVARLSAAVVAGAPAAVAASGGRRHPVIGLWPVAQAAGLRAALVERDERKVGTWVDSLGPAVVEWEVAPVDPFFNVNTLDDAAEAERHLC